MPIRRRGSQAHRHPDRRAAGPWAPGPGPDQRALDPFERALEAAIDGLAPPLQRLLERVAIVIADEPTREQRRDQDLAADETLYGLYEGTPLVAWGADEVPFPNKITLFRVPLEADNPDPHELAAEVRRTLQHELAHHVGFDERGMDDLGLE
ncbi:MAG TPA: metallopeptidase family protein [Candidatus Baltobacteraceae bacterium]|nr:metallopeptidase family protein [Candidatus Baltobacteraceae bacterium]